MLRAIKQWLRVAGGLTSVTVSSDLLGVIYRGLVFSKEALTPKIFCSSPE